MKKRVIDSCELCGKNFYEEDKGDGVWFNYGEKPYSYRGFTSCEDCFEELQDRVENKRERIINDFNSRSLASKNISMAKESYPGDKLAKAHNDLIKKDSEIASNPNWEEENEYRKGKLYSHKRKKEEN